MQTSTEQPLLKNRKLSMLIEEVSTLGLDSSFATIYHVAVELERVRRPGDDRAGKNESLFERLFVDNSLHGVAISLPDAMAICKRFVDALQRELNRHTCGDAL
jgi:hypothetical protein